MQLKTLLCWMNCGLQKSQGVISRRLGKKLMTTMKKQKWKSIWDVLSKLGIVGKAPKKMTKEERERKAQDKKLALEQEKAKKQEQAKAQKIQKYEEQIDACSEACDKALAKKGISQKWQP